MHTPQGFSVTALPDFEIRSQARKAFRNCCIELSPDHKIMYLGKYNFGAWSNKKIPYIFAIEVKTSRLLSSSLSLPIIPQSRSKRV